MCKSVSCRFFPPAQERLETRNMCGGASAPALQLKPEYEHSISSERKSVWGRVPHLLFPSPLFFLFSSRYAEMKGGKKGCFFEAEEKGIR